MRTRNNLEKAGVAQAAILSAMFGCLALALVNLGTELSRTLEIWIIRVGKLLTPAAQEIGPYSGEETVSLVVWLGSWFLLHRFLRTREWKNEAVVTVFLMGISLATTLLWPPVTYWAIRFLARA